MNVSEIKRFVHETLEKAGIRIPVEEKFDYTGFKQPERLKEFVKLVRGDVRNAIYVFKLGSKDGDTFYYDLLFAVNDKGEPCCIPVPIARQLFDKSHIECTHCKGIIPGSVYEYIYMHYYEVNDKLPF